MGAISWSNPNAGEAQTPAQMMSRYEVSGGNVSGVLGELMRQRQIEQQQMQQAAQASIKGIADEVQKQKNDKIAQQFLDQASQYDSENPDATAQIARQLNESNAEPADAWNAFQHYKQSQIKDALTTAETSQHSAMADYYKNYKGRAGAGGVDENGTAPDGLPQVDWSTMTMWNGKQRVKMSNQLAPDNPYEGTIEVKRGWFDKSGIFTNDPKTAGKDPSVSALTGNVVQYRNPKGDLLTAPANQYDKWQNKGAPQTQSSAASQAAGAPAVGTVVRGYRFKGGDPADPNNWEKL